MTISLGPNLIAQRLQRSFADSAQRLSASLSRLSSGSRINSASDDAAGLAIASSLQLNSRVFTQGIRNANDSLSALNLAQGALQQLTDVGMRLKELATQSANGSLSRTQRLSLDGEASQLVNEFNRVISSTSFNGRRLLSDTLGTLSTQVGYGSDGSINFSLGQQLKRNVGIGTFNTTSQSVSVDAATSETLGDFNRDGNLDAIVLDNGSSSIFLLAGRGDGTFSSSLIASSQGTDCASGDIDGDGDLDLVYAKSTLVNMLSNDGSGTFSSAVSVDAGSTIAAVALADVNGDGKLDLLAGYSNAFAVYLGNGNGTFSSGTTYAVSGGTFIDFGVGDFNGDGRKDIVAVTTATASLLINNGQNAFSPAVQLGAGGRSVTVGDTNFDGISDIALLSSGSAQIYLGSSSGSIQTGSSYTIFGAGNAYFQFGDVDNDGILDLSGATSSGLTVLLGNGDGTFYMNATRSVVNNNIKAFVLGDFNNDGVLDSSVVGGSSPSGYFKAFLNAATTETTVGRVNLTTQEQALSSLSALDGILNRIALELGAIGSTQSRIETSLKHLQDIVSNTELAKSRITDTDVAFETAQLTRQQILQQVNSSLLAQSNIFPQIALNLLI